MKPKPYYTCDNCGEKAVYNFQNVNKLYLIIGDDDNQDFKLENEWDGDTNEFYCEKCAEKKNLI